MSAAGTIEFAGPVAVMALLGAGVGLCLLVRRDGWPSRASPTAPRRVPNSPRPPPLRLTPLGRLLALAAAVLLPVTSLAILNSSSGFVWDDIKNLRQAQVEGLSLSYLLEPTSGHFAPGHRLGDWILHRAFGFEFPAAQALLLIGFALSLLLFHRILAELLRPGPGPLLFTLGYGVSMVHVGVTQWWASGLDRVPATVLSFVAILTYVRWHRTGHWPYLAVSVVSVPLALLFSIKPVFVPVYLVLIRVLLVEPGRPLQDSLAQTIREWRIWLLYAVTTGAVAVVYVSQYPTELNQSVDVVVRYLGILWSRVFVPNLFGVFVPKDDVSGIIWSAAVATHIVLVALIVWSVARRASAWRAWVFFTVTFLLNAVVVASTRIGYFPPEVIAYTTYFNLEGVFLFFLALATAVLDSRTGLPRATVAGPVPARRGLLGAGVVAYVALSLWGGYRIGEPEHWFGARSRVILDRAERGLAGLRQSGVRVALVDGVFHEDVVPYLLVPYNSASEVVPLLDPAANFDVSDGELFHVARDGTVQPVAFLPDSGGTAAQLAQSADFGVVGATPRYVGGDRMCLTAGRERVTFGFRPPRSLSGEGLAMRLEFGTRMTSVMSLVADPVPFVTEGLAQRGQQKFRVVNVRPGERQHRIFALDAPELDQALVVLAPHTELCLYRLEVGRLVPR
ncbi:MAG: hypothetical protein M3O23_04870 [Actinomycetota bacterium]|nr:hypothetical protein [Actinomycetota bacterium]